LASVFQNQDNDGIGREVGSEVEISTLTGFTSLQNNGGVAGKGKGCEKTSPLPSVFKNQDNDGIGRESGSAGADFNACPQFHFPDLRLFVFISYILFQALLSLFFS